MHVRVSLMDADPEKEEWDEPQAADDSRELARFKRGADERIYRLRPVDNGAELWRITEVDGQQTEAILETGFSNVEDALAFLGELDRTLRAGGWAPE